MTPTCKTIRDLLELRDELGLTALSLLHFVNSHVRLVWTSGYSLSFAEDDIAAMERYIRECADN